MLLRRQRRWILLLVVVLMLTACGGDATPEPTATPAPTDTLQPTNTPTPVPTSTLTPTSTSTPTLTPTPTYTSTPAPLTAKEIFTQVSPAVAFIDTGVTSGSGVLIEGGYVVTNAHVVWPFPEVRVVFPDGSEYADAPVLDWDLMGDLAVIGPIETEIDPLMLEDGEQLETGTDVFLVGYPAEGEDFPQPSISSGIISRMREWKPIEMTYFQTDAVAAGGQSGGVLVSEMGDVIGISSFLYGEEGFNLVASAADVLPRAGKLISGEEDATIVSRPLSLDGGQPEHEVQLTNLWHEQMYIIDEPEGTVLDIEVESDKDAAFDLIDALGDTLMYTDEAESGIEADSAATEMDAPHFLVLYQWSEEAGDFQLRGSHDLIPYADPDDAETIAVGETIVGNLDYPDDVDFFLIDLNEGDVIDILVDSVMVDPYLIVDYEGAEPNEVIDDDDSGGGLFGLNSKVTYLAPQDGQYQVVVSSALGAEFGAYFLEVRPAPPDAVPAPTAAKPTPSPTPYDTPVGLMTEYRSTDYPFAIQYPAEWAEQESPTILITAAFANEEGDGGALFIAEEDLMSYGMGETTLEEYVDLTLSMLESSGQNVDVISREQIETEQGLPAVIIELSMQGGILKARRLIYMHEEKIGFSATYMARRAQFRNLESLIEYSFSTFEITE